MPYLSALEVCPRPYHYVILKNCQEMPPKLPGMQQLHCCSRQRFHPDSRPCWKLTGGKKRLELYPKKHGPAELVWPRWLPLCRYSLQPCRFRVPCAELLIFVLLCRVWRRGERRRLRLDDVVNASFAVTRRSSASSSSPSSSSSAAAALWRARRAYTLPRLSADARTNQLPR